MRLHSRALVALHNTPSIISIHPSSSPSSSKTFASSTSMPPKRARPKNDMADDASSPSKQKKRRASWSPDEEEALIQAVEMDKQHRMETGHGDDDEEEDWDSISHQIPGRTAVQCLKRFMQIKDDKKDDDASDANASAAAAGGIDWSADDCELLKKLVEQSRDTAPRWNEIANNFSNHNAIDCLSKWQQLTQSPVIKGKGSWTPEEDQILREKRAIYGRKWAKIAAHLPGRQGKQCRERFVNHLDPALKKGEWSDDEEAILIAMHQQYGNRWANISDSLPGRSDNDVKNHWYSTIQRKFQTHGKEKLVQAALQQMEMLRSTGMLPQGQPAAPPQWPSGPYHQATAMAAPGGYQMYPPGYAFVSHPVPGQPVAGQPLTEGVVGAPGAAPVYIYHAPPPPHAHHHAAHMQPPPGYYHYGPSPPTTTQPLQFAQQPKTQRRSPKQRKRSSSSDKSSNNQAYDGVGAIV